ncbi:hypothetical protein [Helicobacter sp.]|uniref:hypothetical protein n=1 Tax=Helicobacter sp. TaxID=218 RepID=UPI00258D1B04|nr:hypothetical protein [Helicobacter sp.]MCI7047697.1 hypothetical protein [Helicobacter sp.]MDY5615710.1 hypothetical protein [Helicobacter sp.]
MKKFFCSLMVMFIFAEQIFACLCAGEISSSFSSLNSTLSTTLNRHSSAITKNIEQAKTANKLIEKKLEQLAELIEKEKQETLEREELIFELQKKIKLLG